MNWGPKGFSMSIDKCFSGFKGFGSGKIYQTTSNGDIVITILAPGIVKDTIKIRAKPTKMNVKADRKPELEDIFGGQQLNLSVDLDDEVIPDSAKAKYVDGVLKITFPLKNPPYEVSDIDYA